MAAAAGLQMASMANQLAAETGSSSSMSVQMM